MTASGSRQWPTSLTNCCASPGGLPRCCLACWCPCLSYAELLKEPELKGYCCHGDRVSACVSYALLQSLGFFPAAALHAGARSALRTERNYSGSFSEDFCATACCSTCSLVQELNAADLRQQQQMLPAASLGLPPRPVRMTSMSSGRPTGSAVTRPSHGATSAAWGPTAPTGGVGFEQGRAGGWSRQPVAARASPGAPLGAPGPALEGLAGRELAL
jgi:Cys-rich protein (TIGR01571 family)